MFKPFKPLTLKRPESGRSEEANVPAEPPSKRRKSSQNHEETTVPKIPIATDIPTTQGLRRPLVQVKNPSVITIPDSPPTATQSSKVSARYTALWRKKTNKKHKNWDGDGYVIISGSHAKLQDLDGKELGRTKTDGPLLPGSTLTISGKDVEIDSLISNEENVARKAERVLLRPAYDPPPRPPPPSVMFKSLPVIPERTVPISRNIHSKAVELPQRVNTGFKNPLLDKTTLPRVISDDPVPRHDPFKEGALVMKRPGSVPKGKRLVDVVVDPVLSKHLREHQRAGVAFMYECVMGLRHFDGEGAILADEMGLGKTLQTIALIWTLLKQNPVHGDRPVIKKALIVCPATLINNWRKEFKKWLGSEVIGVLAAETDVKVLHSFAKSKSYHVLIIGYERLRNVQAELQKCPIDLVVCDEGHRLKTQQNKSAMAIKSLSTERRIILSGTPIQNDLSEFYTMVDFVNPGLLNKYTAFKKDFEVPIIKSRQPGATTAELEKGQARSDELASLTGQFILRRTADILARYLPRKTEYVLFCRPTTIQVACCEAIGSTGVVDKVVNNNEASFQLINILKKVCNGPKLLLKTTTEDNEGANTTLVDSITSKIPKRDLKSSASSKLSVLDSLLHGLRTNTKEKVVIVSNYTATLDLLQTFMTSLDYPFTRLDGGTPVSKRQGLVDDFNRSPASKSFAFLLSAKAGAIGINLIGASRLVLYDIDWNPAVDLQAMARIHRDGQKRPCHIYRLLTKGALEEKIYQRQISKQDLSESIVDSKNSTSTFTAEELKDLFTLDQREGCQTHDSLSCSCGGKKIDAQSSDPSAISSPHADSSHTESGDLDVEDESDGDSLPSLPDLPKFMRSSQIDMAAEERKREERAAAERKRFEKGKGKLQSLMQYSHIDARLLRLAQHANDDDAEEGVVGDYDAEAAIPDPILRGVICEEGSCVDYVFSKSNSLKIEEARLEAKACL